MMEIVALGAARIQAALRQREVSCLEVMQAHLDQISARNPQINAFVTLCADQALEQALALDNTAQDDWGQLAGLPVGIKDVTETAGIRTTFGSRLLADNIPAKDAAIVRRLKAAGAIVLGKTNTPEFAAGANTKNALFGATVNPWDTTRSVGGSTGGGAAALAAHMIPLAEGTDFGGSLRIPASFCGLVGLRPTAGLVASDPVAQPWDVGRVNGPMARSAQDVALMLGAIAGVDDLSPISTPPDWGFAPTDLADYVTRFDPRGLRVAYAPDIAGLGIDADVARTCENGLGAVAGLGLSMTDSALSLSDSNAAYQLLRGQWMVCNYADYLDRLEELNPSLRGNIEAGLNVTSRQIAQARSQQKQAWLRMLAEFETCDLIATPTVPVTPFPVEVNYPDQINGRPLSNYVDWLAQTYLITLTGFPALSVPIGLDSNGMPVGLQLIGKRYSEPMLLGLAHRIQQALPLAMPG
ncbi:amidase [Rhodobaca bogoriensis DSM 18756]|nr:amidase [Rhodobaca bogoriensis DSM 18756]